LRYEYLEESSMLRIEVKDIFEDEVVLTIVLTEEAPPRYEWLTLWLWAIAVILSIVILIVVLKRA